jgi:hypothetical protein
MSDIALRQMIQFSAKVYPRLVPVLDSVRSRLPESISKSRQGAQWENSDHSEYLNLGSHGEWRDSTRAHGQSFDS